MRKNIKNYVKKCAICQKTKTHRHKFYDELFKLFIFTKSWKKINVNMIIKFSSNKWKNNVYDSIMIIVCWFFKMTIYISIRSIMKTNEMCDLFCDEIFFRWNFFKNIVSNTIFLFTNNFWSIFCYHARIKRKLNTTFHSQTND